MYEEPTNKDLARTFQRTLVVVGVLCGILMLWFAHQVFLLIFAGLLLGVLLDGLADLVVRFTKLTRGWSLFITILVIVGIITGLVYFMAPGIAGQMRELKVELPKSISQLRSYLGQYGWGRDVLQHTSAVGKLRALATGGGNSDQLASQITGALTMTAGIVFGMVIILVLGIYSAAEPWVYRYGFLRLFTRRDSQHVEAILRAVHTRMWWWLISVSGSMISLTILAFIGLKILGIPLALTLALLTGLITFIPNFGAVLSAIPPVLIGLMQSPEKALAVIILYVIIQFLEADLITPLIQRQTIRMPPVLGISAQLTFGLLFGFLGLLLAAPIMAGVLAILGSVAGDRVILPERELEKEEGNALSSG